MNVIICITLAFNSYVLSSEPNIFFNENIEPKKVFQTNVIRVLTHNLPPLIYVKWNASTGYPSELSGYAPTFLDLIARRFGFSYSWVPLGRNVFTDSIPTMKGFLDYVSDGEGDLILSAVLALASRNRKLDYTMPLLEGPFSIMIPYPESDVDKNALSKPFQLEVWICTLAAIAMVVGIWHLIQWLTGLLIPTLTSKRAHVFTPSEYVISVLLSQGNYCPSKSKAILFIAGTWCLATLVLIPAYSGNLLSFIVSPTLRPVISSIHDIPNVPGLSAAVDRNLAVDTFLTQSKNGESIKLKNTLIAIDKTLYRCNTSAACVERVLQGTHVYIHGKPIIDDIMFDDLSRTKRCRFAIAKQPVVRGFLGWAMSKQNPLYNTINIGLLELDAFGLSKYWRDKFTKRATKCLSGSQHRKSAGDSKQTRLTWATISTTFVLLGAGHGLALLAFTIEFLAQYTTKLIKS